MNNIEQGNYWENAGRCRQCGGPKYYPMLVRLCEHQGQTLCRAVYHTIRYRVASFIFRKLVGFEPAQKQ